jgi:hypothetical protein
VVSVDFDGAGDALPRPHANCYWLLPGLVLAGEHPGADHSQPWPGRIAALHRAGILVWLNLTQATEPLPDYSVALPADAVAHRAPIADFGVPDVPTMRSILSLLDAAIQDQRPVYLHCHGGIGRTGTVVGCWLREQGLSGEQALALLARKWQVMAKRDRAPESPETEAQCEFIRHWVPVKRA